MYLFSSVNLRIPLPFQNFNLPKALLKILIFNSQFKCLKFLFGDKQNRKYKNLSQSFPFQKIYKLLLLSDSHLMCIILFFLLLFIKPICRIHEKVILDGLFFSIQLRHKLIESTRNKDFKK